MSAKTIKPSFPDRAMRWVFNSEKWCPDYEDWRPIPDFRKSPRYSDGLAPYCKACLKERGRERSKISMRKLRASVNLQKVKTTDKNIRVIRARATGEVK